MPYTRPALAQGAKTITAVSVTDSGTFLADVNFTRKGICITNLGSETIFLGPNDTVTVSDGFPLAAGATLSDELSTDAYYAVAATGPVDVRVMEIA